MGQAAARALVGMVEDEVEAASVLLDTDVQVRESLGPVSS